MLKLIFPADRESPSSSPKSSDYHASDESDSPPVSPTPAGATAQRPSSVKCRAIKDLGDSSSTDDDKLTVFGPLKYDDSDVGTESTLQNEYKPFTEGHSEGSNDELLPPKIVVQKEVGTSTKYNFEDDECTGYILYLSWGFIVPKLAFTLCLDLCASILNSRLSIIKFDPLLFLIHSL